MRKWFAAISKDNETLEIGQRKAGEWLLLINGEIVHISQSYKDVDSKARTIIGTYSKGYWKVVLQ